MSDELEPLPSHVSHLEDPEELKKSIARGTPWLGISIAVHAIIIAIISLIYVKHKAPEPEVHITANLQHEAPPEIIEPPAEKIDRTAVPDDPEQINEEETQLDVPLTTVEAEVAGREDLTNPTTDPNAIDAGPGFGFTGGTSIGVGAGGHYGQGVSSRAGRLGPGGGLGKGHFGGRAARAGGNRTQKLVDAGLDWLKRHQNPKGFWSCDGFQAQCTDSKCSGPGSGSHTVGVTGLALLAFLGAGNTMTEGGYRNTVKEGIRYLTQLQNENTGSFGDNTGAQGWIYDQMLASLAICEAYGLSGNQTLKKSAQRAVAFIQSARNPYKAWRYQVPPIGENDTSVSGWGMMVLRSAKDFGLEVDGQAFDGVKTWVDEMTDPATGRCGYISRGGFSAREQGALEKWPAQKIEAMTAVGMLCRVFLGQDPKSTPELRNGADLLRKSLPLWDETAGTIDYYYWYYGSYAMFQMGGADWTAWEQKMLDAIVKKQATEHCERGSWDPQFDPWGTQGGRVYSTAIMVLTAEVYYRYAKVIGSRGGKPEDEPKPK